MFGLSPTYEEVRYTVAVATVYDRARAVYVMKLLRSTSPSAALAAWDWWTSHRYAIAAEVKRRHPRSVLESIFEEDDTPSETT